MKEKLNYILIFLFLINGIVYFFYPEQIRQEHSNLRYIKYVILFVFLLINLSSFKILNILFYLFFIIILFIFSYLGNSSHSFIKWLLYVLPLSTIVFCSDIYRLKKINKLIIIVYLFSSFVAYYEAFFLNGMFSRYQASGELRITSIFVNPTTLGLIMVLLTYYILMNFIITISIKKKRRVWFILMSINSWLIIIFSGSKTAIVMMLIIYVFFFIYRLKKKSLMFIVNIIFSIFFLSLIYVGFFDFESILNPEHFGLDMKIREFKMTSLESRLIYIKDFFIGVDKNILFPWYNSYSYVDNAYLDIWGTFGLLSLLFFLFHNIVWLIKAYKKKRYFLFNMLLYLLIMGTVTNIFYLSQIAYIYWYIVALINSNKKKVKMKYDQ